MTVVEIVKWVSMMAHSGGGRLLYDRGTEHTLTSGGHSGSTAGTLKEESARWQVAGIRHGPQANKTK